MPAQATTLEKLRASIADLVQEFVPFLANAYNVTTQFGDPTAAGPDKGKPHMGVDFGTPIGTPVYSLGTGIVINDTDAPGGGSTTGGEDDNTITVDYGNGIIVQFAHLSEVFVQAGDKIAEGDFIGKTGNAGIGTGAHLHVGAWQDGEPIDVRALIDPLNDFGDYESTPGATGGSFPILGPLTGGARAGVDSLGQIAAAVVEFVAALINPETWARVLAILAGAVLVMAGGYMLWQST